jgi:hypothetical protein
MKKSTTFKGQPKPFGKSGHFHEPRRHSLQARGIKTGNLATLKTEELNTLLDHPITFGINPEEKAGRKLYAKLEAEEKRRSFLKDTDRDGVPDKYDCDPNDPTKQDDPMEIDEFGVSSQSKIYTPFVRNLASALPHGSGIDGDWYIEEKGDKIIATNSYHAMDEYGGYIGWQDFKLIISKKDPENFKLQFTGDRYIIRKDPQLRNYLEDTFAYSIGELPKMWSGGKPTKLQFDNFFKEAFDREPNYDHYYTKEWQGRFESPVKLWSYSDYDRRKVLKRLFPAKFGDLDKDTNLNNPEYQVKKYKEW